MARPSGSASLSGGEDPLLRRGPVPALRALRFGVRPSAGTSPRSTRPRAGFVHPCFLEHPSIREIWPQDGRNLTDLGVFRDSGVNSAFARPHEARPPQQAEAERSEGRLSSIETERWAVRRSGAAPRAECGPGDEGAGVTEARVRRHPTQAPYDAGTAPPGPRSGGGADARSEERATSLEANQYAYSVWRSTMRARVSTTVGSNSRSMPSWRRSTACSLRSLSRDAPTRSS